MGTMARGTGLAVAPGRPVSFSIGRCTPDQVRDMAAGRTSGELPGQVTDQLAAWPQGSQMAPDQPPASAKLCR